MSAATPPERVAARLVGRLLRPFQRFAQAESSSGVLLLLCAAAAVLPVAGAIGGMVVPALIYAALNVGGPGTRGWGIPMATDIAFALGVATLLGPRVPAGLKVFLAALAIADDIGAVLVIALFYTAAINLKLLALGLGLIVA